MSEPENPSLELLTELERLAEALVPTVYGEGLIPGSIVKVQTRSGPYEARVIEPPPGAAGKLNTSSRGD